MSPSPHYHRRSQQRKRRGAAMIEFAFCLPVFLLIATGTIETCRMLYLRQSAKIAAYECARISIVPGITFGSLQDQCDVILMGRGITGYELEIEPLDPSTAEYEDLVTTTVTVPIHENSLMGNWLYRDDLLEESVTIMAEF